MVRRPNHRQNQAFPVPFLQTYRLHRCGTLQHRTRLTGHSLDIDLRQRALRL